MMRKLYFIIFNFFALITLADNASLIDSAKTHYEKKQYDKAIASYTTIISSGFQSSEVFYNLGNSYFKNNNLGLAILNYEKAKKLSPNDDDIKYNLQIANKKLVDKTDELPQLFITELQSGFINLFSEGTWSVLSIVFIWLAMGLLFLYFFNSKRGVKLISFWSAMACIVLTITTFFIAKQSNSMATAANEGIILEASVTAKGSPADDGTSLFVLHEGTKVKIATENNSWIEIQLANGNKGWVKIKSIGKI